MANNGILILFDIDGTLVRGARCHYQAFVQAIKQVYGLEGDVSSINYAGMTDQQILKQVLQMKQVDDEIIRENFQECLDIMIHYYVENVHRENTRVLEGVEELLSELQNRDMLLGLVTGNLKTIAYAKLKRVGLDLYFPFGGFGSDHSHRPQLVKTAIKRAIRSFGYRGDMVYVIGDTPRDVDAGKASQAITVGVATGRYSRDELIDSGADYVLDDLKDINKILEIFINFE